VVIRKLSFLHDYLSIFAFTVGQVWVKNMHCSQAAANQAIAPKWARLDLRKQK